MPRRRSLWMLLCATLAFACGDGTGPDQSGSRPSLSAGGGHTCGLTLSGEARCWGLNLDGQLGDNSTTDRPRPVALADGIRFAILTAGSEHTCGLTGDGTAYCWGSDNGLQLGTDAPIGTLRCCERDWRDR